MTSWGKSLPNRIRNFISTWEAENILLVQRHSSESSCYDENCKKNYKNPNIEISCFLRSYLNLWCWIWTQTMVAAFFGKVIAADTTFMLGGSNPCSESSSCDENCKKNYKNSSIVISCFLGSYCTSFLLDLDSKIGFWLFWGGHCDHACLWWCFHAISSESSSCDENCKKNYKNSSIVISCFLGSYCTSFLLDLDSKIGFWLFWGGHCDHACLWWCFHAISSESSSCDENCKKNYLSPKIKISCFLGS